MDPMPSPQPGESRPSPGAYSQPARELPELSKPVTRRRGPMIAAVLTIGIAVAAFVGRSPAPQPNVPPVIAANSAAPQEADPLVPARASDGRVETFTDACYRGGTSLDPNFESTDYSTMPKSWREKPGRGLWTQKSRAFPEARSPYDGDLPEPKAGCRLNAPR